MLQSRVYQAYRLHKGEKKRRTDIEGNKKKGRIYENKDGYTKKTDQ